MRCSRVARRPFVVTEPIVISRLDSRPGAATTAGTAAAASTTIKTTKAAAAVISGRLALSARGPCLCLPRTNVKPAPLRLSTPAVQPEPVTRCRGPRCPFPSRPRMEAGRGPGTSRRLRWPLRTASMLPARNLRHRLTRTSDRTSNGRETASPMPAEDLHTRPRPCLRSRTTTASHRTACSRPRRLPPRKGSSTQTWSGASASTEAKSTRG